MGRPSSSVNRQKARLALLALTGALLAFFIVAGQAQQPAQRPDTAQADPTTQESAAQDAQEETERLQPTVLFRSGINFIRVDAIVTDGDGNHVSDLEMSDFEIYEDGELQTIEAFELVEISAVPGPDAEPARGVSTRSDVEREADRSDVRVFVIFFDAYHVRFENARRASIQLTEFLRNNLLPTDLVAVMHPLTPLMDLRLTRNHDLIIDQVDNFFGQKYDYKPRNQYERTYAHFPTETVELIRNDVSLGALRGLMIYLGGIREARKNVLLISEGYTNYIPPQLRAFSAIRGPNVRETQFAGDPFAGNSGYETTNELFRNMSLMGDLQELFATANRFNAAIYALDPRGLATQEYDVSQPNIGLETNRRALRVTQNSLHVLAEETDGLAIVNRNDFVPGLRQMLRDASTYYLLGYDSSRSATDGKFHEIDVRVKREGVNIRSRKGFWAMTERDADRILNPPHSEPPKAVDTALSALAVPARRYLVRTWLGTSRGEDGKTLVTFVWEPTRGAARREEPARVLLTAIGDAGDAFYRGRIPEPARLPGRTGAGRAASRDADSSRATFDADPGVMQVSMAIEGDSGEVLDRDRREIEIPDFTGPDLVFSTPAFIRARNNLEWEQLVEDWEAVPTPSRDFRRTERLLLRFETYAAGTVVPDVDAWLLNRNGDRMYPLVVQPATDGHPNQVDIQPTGLPPAEYIIELTATTSTGEATQLVAFRLES